MKPTHFGWVQIQGKGFFHKWKLHYCAIFPTNQFGKARLEIYANEANFSSAKNGKSVLLADVISIRPVALSAVNPHGIQIQLNNGTIMLMCLNSPEETEMWQLALSRAAFPDQHQTTSIAQVGSPSPLPSPAVELPPASTTEDPAYDIPWDLQQFNVLLIASNSGPKPTIPEGNYELCFKDSLLLKNDLLRGVEAWAYNDITWFGYGDSSFAFQILGSSTFEFKCSRPTDVFERLRTYLRLKNDDSMFPYNLKNSYLVNYIPVERRGTASPNEDDEIEQNRPRSGQQMQKMASASSFMSHQLPSPQRDMNISVDSHHSEAAGATQPKQPKSRRFSFFRRSKKEKKPEKFRELGQGRADFEQSAQSEWVIMGQHQQPRPNQLDLQWQQSAMTSPENLQQPQSPGYANIPAIDYQRQQQYNGNSRGYPEMSPPPPMDPRSPRVIPPSDRFDFSQQDVSPPLRKRAPLSIFSTQFQSSNSATSNIPERPNFGNALSFKKQLEQTIAARNASKNASPPVPRLPPIAEIPQSNQRISMRQLPSSQRPVDPRLRDSIVSEPPTDFVIDARVIKSQRPQAEIFRFPSNGYGRHESADYDEPAVDGGIPLVASQAHKPKHLDVRRLQIAPHESLIH